MLGGWEATLPRELFNESVVFISATETVEKACETLISTGASVLGIMASNELDPNAVPSCAGFFDFADVNAFLLLAIGTNVPTPDDPTKVHEIVEAAKSGKDIYVADVCNLSGKNHLVVLSPTSNLRSLLTIFAQGTHRVLFMDETNHIHGVVSDRRLVRWLADHPSAVLGLEATLQRALVDLEIGISKPVVSLYCDSSVLDAMKVMNEHGVSSIAVIDLEGSLLSAVSVTDIGRLVATSTDRSVLNLPLSQFITLIKLPQGSTDGEDRFPIYSTSPSSTLERAVQLLLATNAHRLFLTSSTRSPSPATSSPSLSIAPSGSMILSSVAAPPLSLPSPRSTAPLSLGTSIPSIASLDSSIATSPTTPTTPSSVLPSSSQIGVQGVVSIVDILSVAARLAGVQDVDPNMVRKHRRSSSSATAGSGKGVN